MVSICKSKFFWLVGGEAEGLISLDQFYVPMMTELAKYSVTQLQKFVMTT